jgi:hypothetical protein
LLNIFGNNCQKYWAAGLPVIPLIKNDKRPFLGGWQRMATQMPTDEEKAHWAVEHADCNMGLVLGPQSGLIALDIDVDDPIVMKVLDAVLPKSPWIRKGAKGEVRIYKFTGQATFRVRTEDGGTICELLSQRTQVVLPPSIHPKTMAPYTANCELLDVIDRVPVLPRDIEVIVKAALAAEGIGTQTAGKVAIASWVPAGARDNAMVAHAGIMARGVVRGERSLREAMSEMHHWVDSFVEKVFGDELDPQKGIQKLIEFLRKDVLIAKRPLPSGWDDGLTDEDKERVGVADFGADNIKYGYTRLWDDFQAEVSKEGIRPGDQAWQRAVETTLDRMAANKDLTAIEEDRLLGLMVDSSARQITKGGLRRDLRQRRVRDTLGDDHASIASAVLEDLSAVHGPLRFTSGGWVHWQGACWEPFDVTRIRSLITSSYGAIEGSKRYSDYSQVEKTMQMLEEAQKPIKVIDKNGINFVNGVLTEDLELIPHNMDYGMTYCLPFPYLPDQAGKVSKWLDMLITYWGDDEDCAEKIEALREAMAATLFGVAPKYQRSFILYGVAGSGKSRIIEIMEGLMPKGCISHVSPFDFDDKFIPAAMANKLMNVGGDLSEKRTIGGEMFKKIIGGETITAQHKNQQPFEYKPICAQWFGSNHMPKSTDSSDGMGRRFLFFKFSKAIPDKDKIEDYHLQVLQEEREAIAAWAVEGYRALRERRGYTLAESHKRCVDEMMEQNNSVRFFISSLLAQGRLLVGEPAHYGKSQDSTTSEPLHREYSTFCSLVANVRHVSLTKFQEMMQECQGKYGFSKIIEMKPNGAQIVKWKYITLVAKK